MLKLGKIKFRKIRKYIDKPKPWVERRENSTENTEQVRIFHSKMGEDYKAQVPAEYDLNAKWDAYIDLGLRRFVYSSFAGGFAGLLLFREYFDKFVLDFQSVFLILAFVIA